MDRQTEDLLKWGAIGAGVFFLIVKPIMSSIGVDPADASLIQSTATSDPTTNAFSVQYQPSVDLFNENPSYDANGNKLTIQQYYQALKAMYDSQSASLTGNILQVCTWAETLNGLLTGWHLSTDDNAVIAVFAQMTDQKEVSEVSSYIAYNFNYDLFTALQGSLFKFGLTSADLATLIRQINNLPQ